MRKGPIYCIDCGADISYKISNNTKICERCKRIKYRNINRITEVGKRMFPIRKKIYYLYSNSCAICNWRAMDTPYTLYSRLCFPCGCEIHHITPNSKGGRETVDNLILLCPNHHKQADLGILTGEELKGYLKIWDEEKYISDLEEREFINKTAGAEIIDTLF